MLRRRAGREAPAGGYRLSQQADVGGEVGHVVQLQQRPQPVPVQPQSHVRQRAVLASQPEVTPLSNYLERTVHRCTAPRGPSRLRLLASINIDPRQLQVGVVAEDLARDHLNHREQKHYVLHEPTT